VSFILRRRLGKNKSELGLMDKPSIKGPARIARKPAPVFAKARDLPAGLKKIVGNLVVIHEGG
jgi:hypothetical protein